MRYQYTSKGYLNSLNQNQTISGVKLLIIINISIFLFMEFLLLSSIDLYERLFYNLSLIPNDVYPNLKIWQCITYLFLHGGIIHLLFNMLGLWFLGYELEKLWGKKKFLIYYFITGFGAAIITIIYNSILTSSYIPIVGASGSIYGLLLAYGILFPDRILYIYGIFPVKVKNAVLFLGGIAFFYSITLHSDGISHITHLAGIIIGFIYLQYWVSEKKSKKIIKINSDQLKNDDVFETRMYRQKQMDKILDRVTEVGWYGLSDEDKEFLADGNNNYYDTNNPN